MYPHERSLVKKLENKPFALIGVNSDRDRKALASTLIQEKITWRSFWNGSGGTSGPISSAWSISGWPTLFLIDHKGVIRKKWVGAPSAAVLDQEIDALVKQAETVSRAPDHDVPLQPRGEPVWAALRHKPHTAAPAPASVEQPRSAASARIAAWSPTSFPTWRLSPVLPSGRASPPPRVTLV